MKKKWKELSLLSLSFILFSLFIWNHHLPQSDQYESFFSRIQKGSRRPASFSNNSCLDLIKHLSDIDFSRSTKIIRAPFGFQNADAAIDGRHLQFGFEAEYGLGELQGIVEIYGPKPEFGISAKKWFSMKITERTEWIRKNIQALFPETRVSGGLTKLNNDSVWDFLPDNLVFDDTGNIEIILKPFDSFEQWYHSVQKLNSRLGTGSMQATISTPSDSFFGRGIEGINPETVLEEKIGMFNFYSDYDIFQKLHAGYIRYQDNPNRQVAQSFSHPYLGPMTKQKQEILEALLRGNAVGEKYEASRMAKIAGWDNSFKYTGGTVYRPDLLGEERVILEARDANKNFSLLTSRLLRSLFFMQYGTKGMEKLAPLRNYDPVKDFQKFSENIRLGLERLFPNKADPKYEYGIDQIFALDVFRNFAFPMRDWEQHLEVFDAMSFLPKVKFAQHNYAYKLEKLFNALNDDAITEEEAIIQAQGLLAKFSESSGLAKLFENYEENVIFGKRQKDLFKNFIYQAEIEAGPLAKSFPEKIWQGPLQERVTLLANLYPNLMKKVENVPFNFDGRKGGTRDIYIISTKEITIEQELSFFEDYFRAVSLNTVSFPLREKASHLYTRIGDRTYDLVFDFIEVDYLHSIRRNRARLESFVEFEDDEFMRLRTYIDNIKKSQLSVLSGPFSMEGAKGRTVGLLHDNRPGRLSDDGVFTPSGEKHNCTSWICTAPIGDLGDDIRTLVGVPPGYEVHTNPGWWSMWLLNYAKKDRVPFAFYITSTESLDEVFQKISENGLRNWRFDPQ